MAWNLAIAWYLIIEEYSSYKSLTWNIESLRDVWSYSLVYLVSVIVTGNRKVIGIIWPYDLQYVLCMCRLLRSKSKSSMSYLYFRKAFHAPNMRSLSALWRWENYPIDKEFDDFWLIRTKNVFTYYTTLLTNNKKHLRLKFIIVSIVTIEKRHISLILRIQCYHMQWCWIKH